MVRPRRPPSQAWRTFLKNHAPDLIALDFFTVPTATFRVLFVLVVLTHSRRRLVHFNVTAHPTAEWTARQILEAFPFDLAIYGHGFASKSPSCRSKKCSERRGLHGKGPTWSVSSVRSGENVWIT